MSARLPAAAREFAFGGTDQRQALRLPWWRAASRVWATHVGPHAVQAAVAFISLGFVLLLLVRDLHDSARAEVLDVQRHLEQVASVGAHAVQSATRATDLQLLELRHEWMHRGEKFEQLLAARRVQSAIGFRFEATVLDHSGRVVLSTSGANLPGTDMSALESFTHLRDQAVDELWVGRHAAGGGLDHSHLDFSRPLLTSQGRFDGIIICAIDSDYLVRQVKELDVSRTGVMSLLRSDGAMLMQLGARFPGSVRGAPTAQRTGQALPPGALLQTEGFARNVGTAQGEGRLLAWRKAADYPIVFTIDESAARLTDAITELRWRYLAAGILLSIAITAGVYWSLRHHMLRERISREQAAHLVQLRTTQMALTASQRELSELSAHQLGFEEAERKRIAREIHDELGQRLTVHRIDLAMLADAVKPNPARLLPSKLEALKADVDAMLGIARDIAHKLRPAALDIGLGAAAESLVREFNSKLGVFCELSNRLPSGFKTDEACTIGAFRILQEAITNAARHANAQRVRVALWIDDFGLGLRVEDDGAGFDSSAKGRQSGFGLSGMRERAITLGGRFEVVSCPAAGTTVEAHIPLSSNAADAREQAASRAGEPGS